MSLKNYRKITFNELTIPVKIGIHQSEIDNPQLLTFDIDLYIPLEYSNPIEDNINEVFDYDLVRPLIYNLIKDKHTMLLETLSDEIINSLFFFKQIYAISLKITKYFYKDCKVSIETFKEKKI